MRIINAPLPLTHRPIGCTPPLPRSLLPPFLFHGSGSFSRRSCVQVSHRKQFRAGRRTTDCEIGQSRASSRSGTVALMSPEFMRRAIALAIENVTTLRGGPFAALVVNDGRVIAE